MSSSKKECNNIANVPKASSAAAGPSSASAGPSSASAGPSRPSSAAAGPSSSSAGPSRPSSTVAGPSSAVAGPSSAVAGPSSAVAGPSSAVAGPSSASAGPSTNANLRNLLRELPFRIQNVSSEMFSDPTTSTLMETECERKVAYPNSTARLITLENNIRILSVKSTLSQVVLLEPLASLTLNGYVKVTVCLGSICIFGYEVKEGQTIKVFSTEGTGLKKIVALNSVHQSTIEVLKSKLETILFKEDIDTEEFINSIQPNTAAFIVEKALFSAPLRVLELYYPKALQAKLPSDKKIKREEKFELCNTEESYTINISEDFKMLSEEVNQMISQPVSDGETAPRILVVGEKKLGKSTLIRYLMNSTLNKHPEFYFLDTDLDQAECTPPGVVSLFRVTNPWLGPPFVHEQQLIEMIFVGSVSPVTFPGLYERSIRCMMNFVNNYLRKQTLFVNTPGLCHGMPDFCLQAVKLAIKPTAVITLVPPDPHLSLRKDVAEITNFVVPSKVPSRESDASSFSDVEMRYFKVLAYLGECQKPYLPVAPINSIQGFKMNLNGIGLHIMGQKLPLNHLVKTIPCSMVALCHVHPSCLLRNNKLGLPKLLCDDLVHECFGFAFVKETDEAKKFFEIITPLARKKLNHVNALITGQVAIPAAIFIKQAPTTITTTFPVRSYLEHFVPFILEGLLKIIYVRPEDPIQYLADWMLKFKDAFYNRMMDGFFS